MADRDTPHTGGPNTDPTAPAAPPTERAGRGGVSGVAGLADGLKQSLGNAAETAMDAGRETIGAAQGRIRSLLEQQTDRAADRLDGVAGVLHKAADQLKTENNGTVAHFAEQAADRMDRVADRLRQSSLDDLVGEVEGFARRQPELFIGGAFALGFLAARFVKSSGERRQQGGHAAAPLPRARRTSDYRTAGTPLPRASTAPSKPADQRP